METVELFEKDGILRELTIEERDRKFRDDLWALMGRTFDVYPRWLVEEFCDHWTAKNTNGRKMAFEKEKTFDVMRRLKTWKNNSQEWNPNKWKKEELKFKDFFSRAYLRSLDNNQHLLYFKHLETKGYKYHRNRNGGQSHLRDPEGKIIWL